MFFGTPHSGGDRTLVALGSAAARVATKLHLQPPSDIVETLKEGSMFSDILQEHWRQQLLSYQIISFWEGIGDVCDLKTKCDNLLEFDNNVPGFRLCRKRVPCLGYLVIEKTLSC